MLLILSRVALALFLSLLVAQIVLTVYWSIHPPDAYQYPSTTYPNATSSDPATIAGTATNETSPPYYPSPWGTGLGNWTAAYQKAVAFVSQLTLAEKVNLTTGVGYVIILFIILPKTC